MQSKEYNYGLKILSDFVITLSGFTLLTQGNQRQIFLQAYSYYFDNQETDQIISQIIMYFCSLSMITVTLLPNFNMKFIGILSFAYYNTFCFNIITNHSNIKTIIIFISNLILLWVSISTNLDYQIENQNIEIQKQLILKRHQSIRQGWYPMEVPVQNADIDSQNMMIGQIVKVGSQETNKITRQIRQRSASRRGLRKRQLDQMETKFKGFQTKFRKGSGNQNQLKIDKFENKKNLHIDMESEGSE